MSVFRVIVKYRTEGGTWSEIWRVEAETKEEAIEAAKKKAHETGKVYDDASWVAAKILFEWTNPNAGGTDDGQ